jgi:hypothetical protein
MPRHLDLTAEHWQPFRGQDLAEIPKTHLLAADHFLGWLRERNLGEFNRRLLLDYAAETGKASVLRRLGAAFGCLLPPKHALHRDLREAMLDHERRRTGAPMRIDILAAPWWQPLVGRVNTDAVPYERLKFVDRWLAHLHQNGISQPSERDYLAYFSDKKSPEPLKDLQEAFQLLGMPAVPSITLELPNAITTKRILACKKPRGKPRRPQPRRISVYPHELPEAWQQALAAMRKGLSRPDTNCPAPSIVTGIDTALCQLAKCCRNGDRPIELSLPAIRDYVAFLTTTQSPRGKARRPATYEMRVGALLLYARYTSEPADLIEALRIALERRQQDSDKVLALKHGKAAEIGAVKTVLEKAVEQLARSRTERTVTWRMTRLNDAASLALFVLLPVRLSDTCLVWGKHIVWDGTGYFVAFITNKTRAPVRRRLPDFLTPVLDALLLRGLDEAFLPAVRERAIREQRPLLALRSEHKVFDEYVSHAWRRHFGTGQHISRTLVHTQLGKLGPEGVEAALEACVQRDERTRKFYQGKAVADALLIAGRDLLIDDLTDEEFDEYFPDLDIEFAGIAPSIRVTGHS